MFPSIRYSNAFTCMRIIFMLLFYFDGSRKMYIFCKLALSTPYVVQIHNWIFISSHIPCVGVGVCVCVCFPVCVYPFAESLAFWMSWIYVVISTSCLVQVWALICSTWMLIIKPVNYEDWCDALEPTCNLSPAFTISTITDSFKILIFHIPLWLQTLIFPLHSWKLSYDFKSMIIIFSLNFYLCWVGVCGWLYYVPHISESPNSQNNGKMCRGVRAYHVWELRKNV